MKKSRQQRRALQREINKVPQEVRNEIALQTVQGAFDLVTEALHKEFGFGSKRLHRLEDAINQIISDEEEAATK